MPSPSNQWSFTPQWIGFGPLRRKTPSRSAGTEPGTAIDAVGLVDGLERAAAQKFWPLGPPSANSSTARCASPSSCADSSPASSTSSAMSSSRTTWRASRNRSDS